LGRFEKFETWFIIQKNSTIYEDYIFDEYILNKSIFHVIDYKKVNISKLRLYTIFMHEILGEK